MDLDGLSHFPMPFSPFNTWEPLTFRNAVRTSFALCASLCKSEQRQRDWKGEILDLICDDDDGVDVQNNETRRNHK